MTPPPPNNSSDGEIPTAAGKTPKRTHHLSEADRRFIRQRIDTVLAGQVTLDELLGDTMSTQPHATPQEEPVTEQQPEVNGTEVAEEAADAAENNSPVEVAGNGGQTDGDTEAQVEAPAANAGTEQAQ